MEVRWSTLAVEDLERTPRKAESNGVGDPQANSPASKPFHSGIANVAARLTSRFLLDTGLFHVS